MFIVKTGRDRACVDKTAYILRVDHPPDDERVDDFDNALLQSHGRGGTPSVGEINFALDTRLIEYTEFFSYYHPGNNLFKIIRVLFFERGRIGGGQFST